MSINKYKIISTIFRDETTYRDTITGGLDYVDGMGVTYGGLVLMLVDVQVGDLLFFAHVVFWVMGLGYLWVCGGR
jgi:hypothetical protein